MLILSIIAKTLYQLIIMLLTAIIKVLIKLGKVLMTLILSLATILKFKKTKGEK